MRRARGMKLLAVAGAAVVALGMVTACGEKKKAGGSDEGLKVAIAYDIGGRGDKSFNDSAAAGLDKAKRDFGSKLATPAEKEARKDETEADKTERLKSLCKDGYKLVIAVGFIYAGRDPSKGPMAEASKACPETKFAIIDDASATAANIANLVFAEEQGSALVGAAAALKSKTGTIGFVGGCDVPLIHKFEAGYKFGAAQVNPNIKVLSKYLSNPPDCPGFNDPASGETTAAGQYDNGADVVYQAAGGSGGGVFRAAKAKNKMAIGVDSDQYETADAAVKDVIITSMLKRVDVAVFKTIEGMVNGGNFKSGKTTFDLKADGVGYSTSGGKISDITAKLDELKKKIIDGQVTVPTA